MERLRRVRNGSKYFSQPFGYGEADEFDRLISELPLDNEPSAPIQPGSETPHRPRFRARRQRRLARRRQHLSMQDRPSMEPQAGAESELEMALRELEWEGEVNRGSIKYAKWVQRSLNTVQGSELAVDGIIGPITRNAIRSFQQKQGLAVDGIVGPMTEAALIKSGATPPPGTKPATYPPAYPRRKKSTGTGPTQLRSISIRSGVLTNPEIDQIVNDLDTVFGRHNMQVDLTSGVRTAEDQLRIIKNAASKYKVDQKYPAIKTATVNDIESWLPAWDTLLQQNGYIVNPPKPACSRIRADKKCYDISPHMKGHSIDLTGHDLDDIAGVVQEYCQTGGAISQILIERKNGAVHVGIGSSSGTCNITEG